MFHSPTPNFKSSTLTKLFHVKQFMNYLIKKPIHELLFYIFVFLIPIQTRILYQPEQAYISWYFNYHLAIFVYLSDLVLVLCFITWFIFGTTRNIHKNCMFWLILGFFLWILIDLFHVKPMAFNWYTVFKWLELLILILYIKENMTDSIKLKITAGVIFFSAILQSILGILQFHVQHSLGLNILGEYIAPLGTSGLATIETVSGKLIRAYGTMPHPNILGAFLLMGLVFGLFLLNEASAKSTKIIVSCGTFLIILAIFLSFSRLTWLSTALITFCFFCYFLWKQSKQNVIILIIVSLVSCATIGILWHSDLKARVVDSSSTSITDRYFFDKLGFNLFKQNPIFGVGIGNYVPALEAKYHLEAWQYQPAHNIFIFIAAELGIVGLGLFIWILFELSRGLKRIFSNQFLFTYYLLLITFLLMGQFDHYFVTIQQGRLMFFTVLGLIAALPNIYAQKPD
jgi:O-antigen ligase